MSGRIVGATAVSPDLGAALAAELREAVALALTWLAPVPDASNRHRPLGRGWSPREIIGHLIDSASNNHGRFVRAAFTDTLVCDGYDQDEWVALHGYHEQPWIDLLERWGAFNEEVALALEGIPVAALTRTRSRHNLDRVAWKEVPQSEPVTLEYFVRDYIGHLRHHLRQVAAAVAS